MHLKWVFKFGQSAPALMQTVWPPSLIQSLMRNKDLCCRGQLHLLSGHGLRKQAKEAGCCTTKQHARKAQVSDVTFCTLPGITV